MLHISALKFSIFTTEAILLLIALIAGGTLVTVLRRAKTIHRNLRILMFHGVSAASSAAIFRFVDMYNDIVNSLEMPFAFTIMQFTLNGLIYNRQLMYAIERTVATLNSRNYETNENPTLPVILIIIMWMLAVAGAFALNEKQHYLFVSLTTAANFTAIVLILFLIHINNQKIRSIQLGAGTSHLNLDERYELRENIRTLQFFARGTLGQSLCYIAILLLLFMSRATSIFGTGGLEKPISENIVNLAFAFTLGVFPIASLFRHPELRKIACSFVFRHFAVQVAPDRNPRMLDGRNLIVRQTQHEHFAALDDAWKTMSNSRRA